MNILTADRPIDSPRYVIMQSVAGNEMKFIYPDLFKVEVFEVK
jgi:tRNA A37 threonylcarbamoyladenosine biosynthesis protein TsaE